MKGPQKYTRTFRYGNQDIDCSFWLLQDNNLPPDTVVFLGAGQVDNIPQWVALSAGKGVVVVEGLPHWKAHPSGEDIVQFAAIYAQTAFKLIQKTFGATKLNVIAESQAAPASVIVGHNLPDRIRNLVLVRPLGFTVRTFGDSEQRRLRVFRRRLLQTALQLIHHPRNIAIGLIMLRAMLREPSLMALNKKYAVGISYDLLKDCQQVARTQQAKGHLFTLLLGEKDRLFPPKEVLAALKASNIGGITVDIMPRTGHASFATPSSKMILRRAVSIARGKNNSRDELYELKSSSES